MNKTQLKQDLIKSAGSSLVSLTQIGVFTGCGKDAVRGFVRDLEFINVGRKKLYAASDVAEVLVKFKKCQGGQYG